MCSDAGIGRPSADRDGGCGRIELLNATFGGVATLCAIPPVRESAFLYAT